MGSSSFDSLDKSAKEWNFFSILFPTKWSGFYTYKSKLDLREGEIVWVRARGKLQLGVVVGRAEERSDAAEIDATTAQNLGSRAQESDFRENDFAAAEGEKIEGMGSYSF